MARITARNVSLYVDNAAGACTSIAGRSNTATLTFSSETPEVTAYGATYRERLADGLKDFELSIGGFYDGSAAEIDSILFGILGASTRISYGPGGSTTGCTKYVASAVCNNYTLEGAVEGAVTYSATFQNFGRALTASIW